MAISVAPTTFGDCILLSPSYIVNFSVIMQNPAPTAFGILWTIPSSHEANAMLTADKQTVARHYPHMGSNKGAPLPLLATDMSYPDSLRFRLYHEQ